MSLKLENHRKRINFGFLTMAIACLFIFNPNMNIIDVIPDIIGYIIISVALIKISDLNEDIAAAAKYFRYMILVELSKYAAIFWVFGLTHSREQNTGVLLLSFVFAIIDSSLLFIAFNKFFSGLISLGYLYPNTSVLGKVDRKGRSYTEKIKNFTLFFVIFKPVMSVLPEFADLSRYEYDESSSGVLYLFEFIGLLRAMSVIAVSVVGIIWVVKIIRYFKRLNNDTDFYSALEEKYISDVLPKTSIFIKRDISVAFFAFVAASIFMFDFRVNYINIIPDFIGAVILMVGVFICRKRLSLKMPRVWTVSGAYLGATVLAAMTEFYFFDKYYYGAIDRSEEAYVSYIIMCVFAVLATALFLITAAMLICLFSNVIENHTGFVYKKDDPSNAERLRAFHKELRLRLIFVAASAVLVAAADIFHIFFGAEFGFTGALGGIANLIFMISIIKTTMDISEEIETKYMLE